MRTTYTTRESSSATVGVIRNSRGDLMFPKTLASVVQLSDGNDVESCIGSLLSTIAYLEQRIAALEDGVGNVPTVPQDIPVTSIIISGSVRHVKPGDRFTVISAISPINASNKAVSWSVSPASMVATVDNFGNVTVLGEGQCTIVCRSVSNPDIYASCLVISEAPHESAASLTLSLTEADLGLGETVSIASTILPTNTSNKAVTWQLDSALVATLQNITDTSCVVNAIRYGTCTLYAISQDDETLVASCQLTVSELQPPAVAHVHLIAEGSHAEEESPYTVPAYTHIQLTAVVLDETEIQ